MKRLIRASSYTSETLMTILSDPISRHSEYLSGPDPRILVHLPLDATQYVLQEQDGYALIHETGKARYLSRGNSTIKLYHAATSGECFIEVVNE